MGSGGLAVLAENCCAPGLHRARSLVVHSPDGQSPLRAEPDGLAPPRQRAQRGREPALRRRAPGTAAAADRRHGCRPQRRGRASRRSWAISSGSGSAGTKGRCRQSERHVRHREAAHLVGEPDSEGALRFGRTTLLRRRRDARRTSSPPRSTTSTSRSRTSFAAATTAPTTELQSALIRALGGEPPEYIYHGLLLGPDGRKLVETRTGRRRSPTCASRDFRRKRYGRISRSSGCRGTTSTSTSRGCAGSRPRRSQG